MRKEKRPRRLTVLITAVLAITWLMAGAAIAQQEATGSISASDQTGDGATVEVDEVTIEGASGFVVVHIDDGGAPGEVLGHVEIPEGTSNDVTITLDSPVESNVTLWPMLHFDAGEVGTYEFPGPDGPVVVDGDVVMVPIDYAVELPFTGGPNPLLALLGFALLAGGLLTLRRRRLQETRPA